MKIKFAIYVHVALILTLACSLAYAQKVETVDGVKVIHNDKDGKWGKNPEISLEYVKNIGDIESENENVLFHMPSDIVFDSQGNMYVLDFGNHRIQKFDPNYQYIATIGNKGQGPGEFVYPQSLDIDDGGYLYVSDPQNNRIQILDPDGKEYHTIKMTENPPGTIRLLGSDQMLMGSGSGLVMVRMGGEEDKSLPKIFKVLDREGKTIKEFGDQLDYKEMLLNREGNRNKFVVDKNGNVYLAFLYQNRIEKYTPEGRLLWKADRKLNYDTSKPKSKGKRESSGGYMSVEMPQMNRCSNGIAVDEKGRIWVVNLKRQLQEKETVGTRAEVSMSAGGQRSMSLSAAGNTDVKETDAYEIEVYDPNGVLLGRLSLTHFVDDIYIQKDRIYLLDKMRGAQYYEYQIKEK